NMDWVTDGRILRANATISTVCEAKICDVGGGGLVLPIFGDMEQEWSRGLRAVLYILGLLWLFAGVAVVADIFMSAIESITSQKRRVLDPKTGKSVTYK
ncbi:unnamed protein product, partial [Polarella glacialis]